MFLAISTQNMILLGGMAAIFIVFSLVASFVLPRRDPGFPGKSRNTFLLVTGVLFVGMLLAVELFAVEEEEAGEEHAALTSRP